MKYEEEIVSNGILFHSKRESEKLLRCSCLNCHCATFSDFVGV